MELENEHNYYKTQLNNLIKKKVKHTCDCIVTSC